VGLLVTDAAEAHKARPASSARCGPSVLTPPHVASQAALAEGGVCVFPPATLSDGVTALAELTLYGDVVLRLVSRPSNGGGGGRGSGGLFLPGYVPVDSAGPPRCFGLRRLDHCVGNVPALLPAAAYVARLSGFHEFAEFVSADVGTVDSGLNSLVLASNNERVLLPLNEPTHGTRRRSQIQTYLEQHGGPGVQHMALATDDIFGTLRAMAAAARGDAGGGFEMLRAASPAYYAGLEARVGAGVLSAAQLAACEELGVLVDRDDRGLLLQIFSKPVGDRATLFVEIIQRVGCPLDGTGQPIDGLPLRADAPQAGASQAPGCGGFGTTARVTTMAGSRAAGRSHASALAQARGTFRSCSGRLRSTRRLCRGLLGDCMCCSSSLTYVNGVHMGGGRQCTWSCHDQQAGCRLLQ
jgi:4-hydroxyphenylpyruvate dioxygenase